MLFSLPENNTITQDTGFSAAERFSSQTKTILSASGTHLADSIGTLEQGKDICFVTGGRWSAHELRAFILKQTGPARVFISTWAMSEDSSRLLLTAIETGLITELNCIFDRRLPVRKPGIMQLAQQICTRISLVDCHAKITVIQNNDWKVTIIGSANDTNNKRIEAGVLLTNPDVALFHERWMMEQINNGDPFNWKK